MCMYVRIDQAADASLGTCAGYIYFFACFRCKTCFNAKTASVTFPIENVVKSANILKKKSRTQNGSKQACSKSELFNAVKHRLK